MSTPLVSVILPTLNRQKGLAAALQSLQAQEMKDFEVLVVNDGGRDPSPVLAGFPEMRCTYLAHERNRGVSAARNTALRAARGKYLAYLDDDDIFFPRHLKQLVQAIESGPWQAVYDDAELAYIEEGPDGPRVLESRCIYSCDFDPGSLLVSNYIPLPCMLHERALLARAGSFNEQLPIFEDWDLWIRLSLQTPFMHLPQTGGQYRKARNPSARSNLQTRKAHRTLSCLLHLYLTYRRLAETDQRILAGRLDYSSRQLRNALNRAQEAGDEPLAGALKHFMEKLQRLSSPRRLHFLLEELQRELQRDALQSVKRAR